jgi:hypothetical protein
VKTYEEVMTPLGITIPEHLVADAEVPVLTGPQRQGDLMIVPSREGAWRYLDFAPVGAGVQVVHGEATGNTHWLHGDQAVTWARVDARQVVGVVEVPQGAVAYLIHTDEHGSNGIGPGRYEIRRKREQADEIRLVQD